jgi:excisionase family DNA binding protein
MLTDVLTARPLLTVREVATLLRVSTATIYALAARQELPHVRVSNALRFRHEDLETYTGRGSRSSRT